MKRKGVKIDILKSDNCEVCDRKVSETDLYHMKLSNDYRTRDVCLCENCLFELYNKIGKILDK